RGGARTGVDRAGAEPCQGVRAASATAEGGDMSRIVAFAKKELGLKLWPGQAEVAKAFEDGSYSTLVLQCGRRSGKSTLSDVFALFDALARDLSSKLRRGEPKITAIL